MELAQLQKEMPFTMTPSSSHNAEVMVANVSKSSGIEQMLDSFDLTGCETLAIGDSDNDPENVRVCQPRSRDENAPDHVKEAADDVTHYRF